MKIKTVQRQTRVKRGGEELDYAILHVLNEGGIAINWRIACYVSASKSSVRQRLQLLVARRLVVRYKKHWQAKDSEMDYYAITDLGLAYMRTLEKLLVLLGIDVGKATNKKSTAVILTT